MAHPDPLLPCFLCHNGSSILRLLLLRGLYPFIDLQDILRLVHRLSRVLVQQRVVSLLLTRISSSFELCDKWHWLRHPILLVLDVEGTTVDGAQLMLSEVVLGILILVDSLAFGSWQRALAVPLVGRQVIVAQMDGASRVDEASLRFEQLDLVRAFFL